MSVSSVFIFRSLLPLLGWATFLGLSLSACGPVSSHTQQGYGIDSLATAVYNPGIVQANRVNPFIDGFGSEFDIEFKRVYFSEGKRHLEGMKRLEETWMLYSRGPICQNVQGPSYFARWRIVKSEFEDHSAAIDAFNEFVLSPPPRNGHRLLLISDRELWQVEAPGPLRERLLKALEQWGIEVQGGRWPTAKSYALQLASAARSGNCQGEGLSDGPRFYRPGSLPPGFPVLEAGSHNPSLPLTDLEMELLPGFRETFDIEKRELWTLWKDGQAIDPGEFQLEYSLSFRKPTYVDDQGGKWYDRWQIGIACYVNAEAASDAFNRKVAREMGYAKDELMHKGNESRSLLGGNCIVELSGSCKTGGWVNTGYDRLKAVFFPDRAIENGTVLQTFCGGGVRMMANP